MLFCIPKILKNESNSQQASWIDIISKCCFVSQRYWKMKAIHNYNVKGDIEWFVVLYPKDTEKWKQFTTNTPYRIDIIKLFCIPKILKNESNSQLIERNWSRMGSCFVSQRYWKMKAIHNPDEGYDLPPLVVLYPKDTEKWKQFTTFYDDELDLGGLFCIPKILKNESNSQLLTKRLQTLICCFVSQRYWKMKAIHN